MIFLRDLSQVAAVFFLNTYNANVQGLENKGKNQTNSELKDNKNETEEREYTEYSNIPMQGMPSLIQPD